jgi:hypothetical protein
MFATARYQLQHQQPRMCRIRKHPKTGEVQRDRLVWGSRTVLVQSPERWRQTY